jgi:hypothetical protein
MLLHFTLVLFLLHQSLYPTRILRRPFKEVILLLVINANVPCSPAIATTETGLKTAATVVVVTAAIVVVAIAVGSSVARATTASVVVGAITITAIAIVSIPIGRHCWRPD